MPIQVNPVRITDMTQLNALNEAGKLQGFFWVPEELYHRGPGYSRSDLVEMERSPAHFQQRLVGGGLDEESDAMSLGSAVHCAALEGSRFAEIYVAGEELPPEPERPPHLVGMRRQGKANVAAIEEWEATWMPQRAQLAADIAARQAGKRVLSVATFEKVKVMAAHLAAHPIAGKLLTGTFRELSAYWRHPSGVLCRARFDVLRDDLGCIVDLKTTTDASPQAWARAVARWKYHWQAAWYATGARENGVFTQSFLHVCIETEPPYAIAVYRMSDATMGRAFLETEAAVKRLGECMATNEFPGYPVQIMDIELPKWA